MSEENKFNGYNRKMYLDAVRQYIGKDLIKVIVGMRRSGKSVLMGQVIDVLVNEHDIAREHVVYVDKESLEFDFIKTAEDLNKYVMERTPRCVLVDEVQEIDGWERAVASFQKNGIDVYITGSNARMLSSDLATHLAGRYVSISLYTLSFREFMQFYEYQPEDSRKAFEQYLKLGGLPVLSKFAGNIDASYQIIKDIFDTIVLKDVVAKHRIRRVNLLHRIIAYAVDNIGALMSANSVAKYLKSQRISLDVETVQDYLGFLTSTYALHAAPRYDIKGKSLLESNPKYYLGDLGLRHALVGYREADINKFLENIVYLELLRRGYQVSVGKIGDLEVDFVAQKPAGERLYIQVAYLLTDEAVIKRETRSLKGLGHDGDCWIISMDELSRDLGEITHANLLDWLLDQ